MIIDTHAHYDDEKFDNDRAALLGQMQESGIGLIVNAGSTLESWDRIVKLTEEYPFVYGATPSASTRTRPARSRSMTWSG